MIDKNLCTACGVCLSACPVNAISYDKDGKAQIDPNICIECGICVGMCPTNAIDISDVAKNRK
ncbi:MAG: 4Fe-4S binding protein [Firmicutes bacterium]|nr:4Fe-4S binding protein [Bacillota bacterium]